MGADRRTLWVLRGDSKAEPAPVPVPVPVRIGLSDGTMTEIVEGDIKEGDLLVVEALSSEAPQGAPSSRGQGASAPRMRL